MTTRIAVPPTTLLSALEAAFRNALRTPEGVAKPVALLWADTDGQWRALVPRLRSALPQFYELGAYDPATRTGPVIWLKCVVDRSLPEATPPAGAVPILYLPGVSRQQLRAGGDCPADLQPLIELQYRGDTWRQRNGRDWTVEAFLTSDDGLGLNIAQDAATRAALLRALPLLADTQLGGLRDRRLDESDFNRLAVSDPVRDMLLWIADPEGFRAGADSARWETFRAVCKTEFQFDPDASDAATAASTLATGYGNWEKAWGRFREAPRLYRSIAKRMRDPAAGPRDLLVDPSRQPIRNDEDEAALKRELAATVQMPHHQACARVLTLETEHGTRRSWVWAELGESPFATTLEPLARLAALARLPVGGASLESMANAYADGGWRADRATIEALAITARWPDRDRDVIAGVVRALYTTWLDTSARRFQELAAPRADGLRELVIGVAPEADTCVVFVDGLRFDVGALVQDKLEGLGHRVRISHRFSPLPTVTATAKPAATPMAEAFGGPGTPEDFTPALLPSSQLATAPRIRDELARRGVEVLEKGEVRIPTGTGGGWAEVGELDTLGHQRGIGLAAQIDDEAERISTRVVELLEAGWRRVRVVTDHGWLLLPGGLPKIELPPYLVAPKWARCAAVRGASPPDMPTYPWHWNARARIASPPGIGSFFAGNEYAHGGVSLQECVLPVLLVERTAPKVSARITGVEWRGMRCKVSATGGDSTVRVDLRRNRRQSESSIVAQVKELGTSGEVSLVVTDDNDEGASATVVLLDAAGNVLDHKPTSIGEAR